VRCCAVLCQFQVCFLELASYLMTLPKLLHRCRAGMSISRSCHLRDLGPL
jgi:hypothetical protein